MIKQRTMPPITVDDDRSNEFIAMFEVVAEDCNQIAHDHGFYEVSPRPGERIALMHEELSEALSAARHGDPPDDHIPEYTGQEAELADCIIRIMDYAHENNLRVANALIVKMNYNRSRPYKHGKKF